ncbi:MAG TPA: class I lanthipeptide [Kofleriaceae bacterium]
MKNQLRIKLALRKETVRALHQVELADVVGGLTAPQTVACPSVRVKCNTTPAP